MAPSPYACNVIIDLEFTFVPKGMRVGGIKNEIIEIGAVKVDALGTPIDTFSRIVKPTISGHVSNSVRHMTGISDDDLVTARPIDEVLAEFSRWIGEKPTRIVTWSPADKLQIGKECAAKGIEASLPSRWLDIQRIYPRIMGTKRRMVSLEEAAYWCGIDVERFSAHRALYDAQITAELFRMMATGECHAQRKVLETTLSQPKDSSACASSIADRCGGGALADLLAVLTSQEAAKAGAKPAA